MPRVCIYSTCRNVNHNKIPKGLGSIPGATKFSDSGSGTGSTQPREYNQGAT
jgi:hypothetical protein